MPPHVGNKLLNKATVVDVSKYLRTFIEIGLTEREAKVYITLLSGRVFTAADLQKEVNIPRTKIYEVLNKMVSRNICTEKKLGNASFVDKAPAAVVDKEKAKAEDLRSAISQLEKQLTKIAAL